MRTMGSSFPYPLERLQVFFCLGMLKPLSLESWVCTIPVSIQLHGEALPS